MSRAEKELQRLRDRQFTGWTFESLERVLLRVGFREVSRDGSHRTYKHPENRKIFTLKAGAGELKCGYPRDALKRIEEIEAQHDNQPATEDARRVHGSSVDHRDHS